jgi:hypothetical protein
MNSKTPNIVLIIILILFVLVLSILLGTSIIDLPEDDHDFSMTSSFPIAWIRTPIHQMASLLNLGISIFTLFIVYLGGRSKHRRFNDRTINSINIFVATLLKTALIRAVFNSLAPYIRFPSVFTGSVIFILS